MLALGLYFGRVMLVDEATGEEKWTVQAHAGEHFMTNVAMSQLRYDCVAMSPNGRFVVSVGGFVENWKLWEAADGAEWMAGAMHDGTGACICEVDELGHRVVQEGCPVVAHTAGIWALAFSPCGQRFATGDDDGVVILWDAQTGEAEQRMQAGPMMGHSRRTSISFSADGTRVASGCLDPSIYVWDATTGALLQTITKVRIDYDFSEKKTLFFSPADNRILVSVGSEDSICVWDVESGEMIKSLNDGRLFAAFSPDGRTIATASTFGARDILLIDVESGEILRKLGPDGHRGSVLSASFLGKEGSKLVSGITDGTCKVWDSSTGALLRSIVAGGWIGSLAWGPDWVRDTAMAFAMGHHLRLGGRSQVLELEAGVLRMILDRV